MSDIVVKNGLDIPIAGASSGDVVALPDPETVAYSPTEIRGFTPRVVAREGDEVKVGSPLLLHKPHPSIVLRSPVAGRVKEIRRGHRRVITDYIVERHGDAVASLPSVPAADIAKLSQAEAIDLAAASGWWPAIRARPLSAMADPTIAPQAVLIAASETGPLQPSAEHLIEPDDAEALQAAVDLLRAASGVDVHVTRMKGDDLPAVTGLQRVSHHTFSGPHPAGDPAVQINLLCPPRGAGVVWFLRAWDAVSLGHTILSGRFHATRVIAAVGAAVRTPRLVRTLLGAPLRHVVSDAVDGSRWLRGSVLTGEAVDAERWTGFYSRAVHVLSEEVPRDLFGWATPQLGKWSFHKAFLRGFFTPSKPIDMRPGLYGGHRAIVPIGAYEKVVATPDILPEFLFKSIVAGDLEESIQLGLLDLSEEEAALCSYICPSKIDFDVLLREGLDLYEQEA
ncbi:MAG: Na+-transporting NADH:ubiquinone oxidoreductase subunit A [Myxococcota bacterium]|jgi:Na+-transporting NADH:ubiquinone oxidoreductase subunit A